MQDEVADVEPVTLRRGTSSVAPIAVDATDSHHRSSFWAALILVAGAALLVTATVVHSQRALDRLKPGSNAPALHHFVQLDEVLITSTLPAAPSPSGRFMGAPGAPNN